MAPDISRTRRTLAGDARPRVRSAHGFQMSVSKREHIAAFSPKRILHGFASSALGQVFSFLQAFLLVPWYLEAWGVAGYGRWLAISAAVAHLALLDLGGQSFIGNALAHDFAHGDEERFRRKLEDGLSFYLFFAGFVFLVLCVSILALPSSRLAPDDRLVALLVGGAYLLTLPGGVLASCYRASAQIVRGNVVGNVFRGVSLVALGVALISKIGRLEYALAFFFLYLGNFAGVYWDLRSRIPIFRTLALSWKNAKQGVSLLRGSLSFWLISISQTLNSQGFVLLLATLLGAPAVVLYSTHKTATGIIGYSTSLFQPAVWSELSFLAARQERERTARVMLLAVRATVLFAGALSVALWFAAPAVYSIWTREAFRVQPGLLALLIGQALLAAGWSTASWPLLAANQHHEVARWSLLNSVLTLLGAAMAIRLHFGIEGAVIASIASDLICGLWAYPLLSARYLNFTQPKFYLAMLRSLVAMVPAVLLAQLSLQLSTSNWSRLVWFGFAGLLSAVPALWVSLGRRDLVSIHSFWRANEESSR